MIVGEDSVFTKMDQIREQQERLARLHFELDSQQEAQEYVLLILLLLIFNQFLQNIDDLHVRLVHFFHNYIDDSDIGQFIKVLEWLLVNWRN